MSNDREHLDSVERALLELRAAERAGVFAQTHLDPNSLVRAGAPSVGYGAGRAVLRWLPAAAVLGFAAAMWGLVLTGHHGVAPDDGRMAGEATGGGDDLGLCDSSFFGCFSGPRAESASPEDCQGHDYDSDGDVDLADFGAYQLAYVDPQTHTH